MIQSNGYLDQLDQLRSSLKLLRHVKSGFFYLYGFGQISSIGAKWILASWEDMKGEMEEECKQATHLYVLLCQMGNKMVKKHPTASYSL